MYIDSDTVINDDIAKLYSVDIGDAMFGAVRDTFAGKNTILAHYIENVVGIERDEYVNSGVLLMNLDKIRQAHLADRFLKLMAEYHFDSVAPDQDYINAMCAKEIYFLDKEWNVMPNKGGEYIARPKLIHYNLFDKPWHYSEIPYEEYFWQYAAESGFYPLLIKQRKQYGDNERKADRENLKKLLARAENIADGDGVKFSDVVGSRFVVDSGFVKDSSDLCKINYVGGDMIGDREQVYENIRTAVSLNQLNSKVEPGDPKLLREDKEALLRHYIDYRTAYGFV